MRIRPLEDVLLDLQSEINREHAMRLADLERRVAKFEAQPKPTTKAEADHIRSLRAIEAKLKEKNHD